MRASFADILIEKYLAKSKRLSAQESFKWFQKQLFKCTNAAG